MTKTEVAPDNGTINLYTDSELLGYTFWIDENGIFMSAPSFQSGGFDLENAIPVGDWESFDELSAEELSHLFGYVLTLCTLKRDYVRVGYYSNLFGGTK
tara:strand:- start:189 stop:485 length:297 start_codon:yes stop_codon:yes gene_type:complete